MFNILFLFFVLHIGAASASNDYTFYKGVGLGQDSCSSDLSKVKLTVDDYFSYFSRTQLTSSLYDATGSDFACGLFEGLNDNELHNYPVVAIPFFLLDELSGYRDSNNNVGDITIPKWSLCGAAVDITYNDMTVTAMVADKCEACKVPNWNGNVIDPKMSYQENCDLLHVRHIDMTYALSDMLKIDRQAGLYNISVKFQLDENNKPVYLHKKLPWV